MMAQQVSGKLRIFGVLVMDRGTLESCNLTVSIQSQQPSTTFLMLRYQLWGSGVADGFHAIRTTLSKPFCNVSVVSVMILIMALMLVLQQVRVCARVCVCVCVSSGWRGVSTIEDNKCEGPTKGVLGRRWTCGR